MSWACQVSGGRVRDATWWSSCYALYLFFFISLPISSILFMFFEYISIYRHQLDMTLDPPRIPIRT